MEGTKECRIFVRNAANSITMAHIIIQNIGPIRSVELDLNKINVFMGPQSSGKSTIAKIISFCSWFEKNSILKTQSEKDFYKELLEFHNFEESYFCETSYIEYQTNCCHITFSGKDTGKPTVQIRLDKEHRFENRKIEYIPAERNFVALKGLGKYNDTRDNILNFLYDWFQAKQDIKEKEAFGLPLPSLSNVSYYYDKEQDADNIRLEDGKTIHLRHSSSGLMSVTPLLLVFHYIVKVIYTQKRAKTPFEMARIQNSLHTLNSSETQQQLLDMTEQLAQLQKEFDNRDQTEKSIEPFQQKLNAIQESLNNIIGVYSDYFYSEVIIEEPELNLFPQTQRDLIYYMLHTLNETEKKHQLILTTHSPYILFALNNCMAGGLVRKNIPASKQQEYGSHKAWIDPKQVSIYEIHKGTLRCIQDEDGIIEDNYLNQAYKEISAEYLSLLNYYDDEE